VKGDKTMKISVIGVVPPCPRCKYIYDLAIEAAEELGIAVEMKKLAYDADESQKYGKVGTAHHIAEWAAMEMDWSKIREIISEEWSQELDDFLMPCTKKAQENGWLMTPVLVIDDKVVFSGYVPTKEAIKETIQKAAQP
jgi:disulfide oxidoreductase YuzD